MKADEHVAAGPGKAEMERSAKSQKPPRANHGNVARHVVASTVLALIVHNYDFCRQPSQLGAHVLDEFSRVDALIVHWNDY